MTEASEQFNKPRVLIYFSSHQTGGPGSVVNRTSQALQKRGFEVGWMVPNDSLKLLPKPEDCFADKVFAMHVDGVGRVNSRRMLDIYHSYAPHIIITEQQPISIHNDSIKRGLERIKQADTRQKRHTPVYGIVHDSPMPLGTHTDRGTITDLIDQHYEHLFIRGDEKLLSFDKWLEQNQLSSEPFKDKMSYVGYTIPEMAKAPTNQQASGNIAVNFGGGFDARWDKHLYHKVLKQAEYFANRYMGQNIAGHWQFFVSPAMPESERQELKKQAEKINRTSERSGLKISIHDQGPDYLPAVENADMVITRSGLSGVEAVKYGKPTLLIPRIHENVIEQVERANGLKALAPEQVEVVPQTYLQIVTDATDRWSNRIAAQRGEDIQYIQQPDALLDVSAFRKAFSRLHEQVGRPHTPPDIRVNGHETMANYLYDKHYEQAKADNRVSADEKRDVERANRFSAALSGSSSPDARGK